MRITRTDSRPRTRTMVFCCRLDRSPREVSAGLSEEDSVGCDHVVCLGGYASLREKKERRGRELAEAAWMGEEGTTPIRWRKPDLYLIDGGDGLFKSETGKVLDLITGEVRRNGLLLSPLERHY